MPASKIVFLASVFLDRCRIHSTLQECSPFLSLGHSDAKEKAALLLAHFVHKGAPICPGLTWLLHLYRSHEANLTHLGGFFQRGGCFKIHSLSQMEPNFPSQLGITA